MATKPTTQLDFDQLKSDIITFIKSNPTYTDYNFEGSALNAIVDILAYNTHTNAYYANMQHSEGFLDTAQKRSSVVSRAKELGYIPHSVSGSNAYIDITVSGNLDSIIYLPRGTIFSSANDLGSFTFISVDDHTYSASGLNKVFENVRLVEGSLVTNTFLVNSSNNPLGIYTIPNENIDISTMKVWIRESSSSSNRVEYTKIDSVLDSTSTSKVYFIQESYDGYYQIYFGDNIVGASPANGNIVEIEYVNSKYKSLADGCKTFSFETWAGTTYVVTTTQSAFGGSEKETIDSIKYNAVNTYTAKNRAVTSTDYESLIKQRFSFIKSVSVWGGEDNNPPVYGKVFISLQPVSGYTLTDDTKQSVILPVIKNVSMMTVLPEFVDPEYIDIEFKTFLKYNQNKTTTTKNAVETLVKSVISTYVTEISKFSTDYLHSALVNRLIDLDPGIQSVAINKLIGFKLTPPININTNHVKSLNNQITAGSIYSTKFNVYTDTGIKRVQIKEIPGSTQYTIDLYGVNQSTVRLGLYDANSLLISDIGTVKLTTGEFNLTFNLYSYITASRFIYIRCKSVSDDLVVARNQILTLQPNIEDLLVSVFSNNAVITEIYDK